MNSFSKALLSLLLFAAPLIAGDEIIIHLPTEQQLMPTSVQLQGRHPFSKELTQILTYDLNVNGYTQVTGKDQAIYKVKGKFAADQLIVQVYSSTLKGSFEVPLSGSLARDRRSMHQLADAIIESLFHVKGIASSRILYTVKKGEKGEVWTADYDGKNTKQVTHENNLCVTPAFLPPNPGQGAGSIFYACYQTGQSKIYIKGINGAKVQRFTSLRGNQLMPAISPQRDKVAFISDAAGNPDLFMQEFSAKAGAIGKPRQIFTAPRSTQASPTFSSDGNRLAFVSNKDGRPRIYVLDLDNVEIEPKVISRKNRENTSPCWSPDGTKIAYSAMTDGVRQIWIYELASDKEWQLTSGPTHKENPCWAANNLHLLFNSSSRTGCELYLVNLNAPKAIKITSGPGEKRFAAWEPR